MFALLEHTTSAGVHWDLLVETSGREGLATWRLASNPVSTDGTISAEAIGDHRRAYLDYEGDIGGGRGSVRRVDRGQGAADHGDAGRVLLRLEGARLSGEFEIVAGGHGALFRRRAHD